MKSIRNVIIIWILIYLIFSFIEWEMNPNNWKYVVRQICGLIFGFGTIAILAIEKITDLE